LLSRLFDVRRGIAVTVVALAVLTAPMAVPSRALLGESPIVFSLDLRDGEQQWRTRVASGEANPIVLFADRRHVFVQVRRCSSEDRRYRRGDSNLVALNANTGEELWRSSDVGDVFYSDRYGDATPSGFIDASSLQRFPSGPIPVLARRSAEVWAIDPRTGTERWRSDSYGLVPISNTDELVILGPQPGHPVRRLVAIDRNDGRVRWDSEVGETKRFVGAASDGATVAVLVGPSGLEGDELLMFHRGQLTHTVEGLSQEHAYGLRVVDHSVVLTSTRVIDVRTGVDRGPVAPSTHVIALASTAGEDIVIGEHREMTNDLVSVAFDLQDRSEVWRSSDPFTRIIDARTDTALAVTDTDDVITLDSADGAELWRRQLSEFGQVVPLHRPSLRLGASAVYVSRGCEATARD
jgi:outer membrane protein assembly factor BamB